MPLTDKETCKNCKISGGAHYKDCPLIKPDTTLVNDETGNTFIVKSTLSDKENRIKCTAGGAYRNEQDYIEVCCAFCLRDMPYELKDGAWQQLEVSSRDCMGRCDYGCDYVYPYGFVPEADCPVHNKIKEIPIFEGTLDRLNKLTITK